jgi:hypothetical protein
VNQWTMDRRSFVGRSLAVLLSLAGIEAMLTACGSSSGSSSTPTPANGGNCDANGTSISIQLVHSPNHTLTIPSADVIAGVAKTYTLADNGSGHTHQVTISAADFLKLQQNQGIQETSTATGHTHLVTVDCA